MGQEKLPQRFQHRGQRRVAQAVDDLVAFLAGFNQVLVSQHGQMLRSVRLFDANFVAQPSHRHFSHAQLLDDGDPRRMRQGLKDPALNRRMDSSMAVHLAEGVDRTIRVRTLE